MHLLSMDTVMRGMQPIAATHSATIAAAVTIPVMVKLYTQLRRLLLKSQTLVTSVC